MTRQATGKGPLRPPPGHVLQSHNSHNPPNHPQTALDHQHSQPTATKHRTSSTSTASQATAPRPITHSTSPRTDCYDINSLHPDDQLRAPTTKPQGCPLGPPDGLASQPPDPDDHSPSTAPNYNSHPMHLRCKQNHTKPFIFQAGRVNILFTFEAKPLN